MVEQEMKALNGDTACAFAIKQCNPDVVAAYPITPQTIIVEAFSEYVANGEVDTEFIAVESEHSAMSTSIGAAAAGARAYTASASQGLALMYEMLYVASGLRLPITMTCVNRSLSAPINIHGDHSDAMGGRDSGWIQLYCENSQEAYDTSIQAWRIAEHLDVQLPVMVNIDGFILSHTLENVSVLPDEAVKKFIGEKKIPIVTLPNGEKVPYMLTPKKPVSMGAIDLQNYYFEHKRQQVEAMENALKVIEEVGKEYGKLTGRTYGLIDPYLMDDAEVAVVVLGSTAGTAKFTADQMRNEGIKAGVLRIRAFRPFPKDAIIKTLSKVKACAILDRSLSFGAYGGPVFNEVRSAFCYECDKPLTINYIYGLGGRDTPPKLIAEVFKSLQKIADENKITGSEIRYLGLRDGKEGTNYKCELVSLKDVTSGKI
ncbi:MAG: transketolase C-terminal domain-containing protein [Candidatus Odinarchaeia archaeon]